jgi:arylsulfatase A-like enzyme
VVTYAKKAQPGALPMVSKAIRWLIGNYHENYFLWVHLFDDHFPYTPPWPFWSSDHPSVEEVRRLYSQLRSGKKGFGEFHFENDLSEETRDYLRELYRGEVAYTDRAVGLLLRTVGLLNTLDPGRKTLVIYTADHGESLGEHEYYFQHGNFLYDVDLRVPLIVSFPEEIPGGATIDTQVRSIDILPTILELLGEPVPENVSGKSLFPMIRGEREEHRVAYIESDDRQYPQNPRYHLEGIPGRWRAVTDGRRKLIRIPHPDGDIHEYYDLEKDPDELTNLYPAMAEEAAPLMALLDAWLASATPGADEAPEMDEETLEMLRSMGYVD